MTIETFNLPSGVAAACRQVERDDVVARIWAHDHTLWGPSPDEIVNRLGWLHVAKTMRSQLPAIERFVGKARSDGFGQVVLLGMGGSSLAAAVLASTFGPQADGLPLRVVDTTHPAVIDDITRAIDLERTLFLVATKSGTTTETLSLFKYFYNQLQAAGISDPGRSFVAITDPGSRLVQLADKYRFRATFLNDPGIGGRYAALSLFGLIPAALLGSDAARLLDKADAFARSEGREESTNRNSAAWLGVVLGELAKSGLDKATFLISEPIASFGAWVEQLIAESTGKDGIGILPVVGERLGSPAVYGKDRVFIQLRRVWDDVLDAQAAVLRDAGHPLVRIEIDDVCNLGREFFRWEFATAVACHVLGVNAFDQPNVESAKVLAREMLEAIRESGAHSSAPATPLAAARVSDFLAAASPGDYAAIQAYLPSSDDLSVALGEVQTAIRDRFGLATTLGYGPRFLHSTGQLHKGDRGNGHFIQLVSGPSPDLPIPDIAGESASGVSFNQLIAAQAAGDRQALENAGRPTLTLAVGEAPSAEIRRAIVDL